MKPENDNSGLEIWLENPLLVKRFIEQQQIYAKLGSEIAYILSRQIQLAEIPIANITFRAKELASFLEKTSRKGYKHPLGDMTDLAGVRVVCYYPKDLVSLQQIIDQTFEVIEVQDKTEMAGVDRFGYGGIHSVVRLSPHVSGARYDDLKAVVCEVQVRTVMQDAWAMVSHHLLYKREQDVPRSIVRTVNSLAATLDLADTTFQQVRDDRDQYLKAVTENLDTANYQHIDVNADSIRQYLVRTFPEFPFNSHLLQPVTLDIAVQSLLECGFAKLDKVDKLIQRTASARDYFYEHHPAGLDAHRSALGELVTSIYIVEKRMRLGVVPQFEALYQKAHRLVS